MDHIKILFTVINMFAGISTVVLLIQSRRHSPRRFFLRPVAAHTVFYNFLLLIAIFDKYTKLNIPSAADLIKHPLYEAAGNILFMFLIAGMTLSMYSIRYYLLTGTGRPKPKHVSIIIISTVSALSVLSLLTASAGSAVIELIVESVCDVLFCGEALLLFLMLYETKKTAHSGKIRYRAASPLIIFYLSRYLLLPAILLLPVFQFALSLLILAYCNAIPFLWYVLFARASFHRERIECLAEEYNISKREAEVIKLMLNGKSNGEIEEVLCISPHTVKNHIYRIFRKLNINSRYQLLSLFVDQP